MKQTIVYKNKNNCTIKADFYRTLKKQAPVVVYIHGGGLIWGSREDISEEMVKLFIDNGLAVFSIDYRLAPESKLSDILEDIQDALFWLESEGKKQFSIDPRRIAVVGGSAGGFLSLCTGTFKNKPRAIVSLYGYGDISVKWAINPSTFYLQKELIPRQLAFKLLSNTILTEGPIRDRYLIYLYARQQGVWIEEITGINPFTNNEALLKFCPLHNVTEEYPPTLFLHGTMDTDVPYEQSVFMRAALVKKGVYTRLITIPNGEHVFEKDFYDPIVQNALEQMIEFLQNQLG
ncbi:alpha/beta hydrolase [Neobacillus niacini]|uniref:alpha/beta hydrolase n=1 Tax=Neobacillus niacini TaxID=86668 RepID=UPI002FFE165E